MNKNIRVLHILWDLDNGGTQNMMSDIINEHIKAGIEIHLLIIDNYIKESILNRLDKRCIIYKLGRNKGSKNPMFIFRLNLFLLKNRFDVIHIHSSEYFRYIWIKRNYVRTVHNTNQRYHCYRWHKAVFAISESAAEEIIEHNYKNPILANNGVNLNLIERYEKPSFDGKHLRMVQVSRLMIRQKGQDILLKAINELVKNDIKNIHLDLIGEGESESFLREIVLKMNLNDYVSFLGDKSREWVYQNLKNYDLFVQPSRFEGFGLTVAEAMGAGVPCLVSSNDGPLQIIENGKYGYSFILNNYLDCANKIKDILENYPSKDFIDKSYSQVAKNYSIQRTADIYLDTYYRILKK